MKNKIDYSKLSDFEINKLIDRRELINILKKYKSAGINVSDESIFQWSPAVTTDYCNSWEDMGPLIEKIWSDLVWCTDFEEVYWDEVMRKYNCGKLRAAAIVYLMIGEEDEK